MGVSKNMWKLEQWVCDNNAKCVICQYFKRCVIQKGVRVNQNGVLIIEKVCYWKGVLP